MGRRRWLVVLTCVVLTVFAAGVTWWMIPEGPINRANFDKLQLGMTQSDIEAILGPATDPDDLE